jgi:hypothetical protein
MIHSQFNRVRIHHTGKEKLELKWYVYEQLIFLCGDVGIAQISIFFFLQFKLRSFFYICDLPELIWKSCMFKGKFLNSSSWVPIIISFSCRVPSEGGTGGEAENGEEEKETDRAFEVGSSTLSGCGSGSGYIQGAKPLRIRILTTRHRHTEFKVNFCVALSLCCHIWIFLSYPDPRIPILEVRIYSDPDLYFFVAG